MKEDYYQKKELFYAALCTYHNYFFQLCAAVLMVCWFSFLLMIELSTDVMLIN